MSVSAGISAALDAGDAVMRYSHIPGLTVYRVKGRGEVWVKDGAVATVDCNLIPTFVPCAMAADVLRAEVAKPEKAA